MPPSSDGYKKPAPKSLRKPSGKKADGQEDHKGQTLKITAEPDEIILHMPAACEGCPQYEICRGMAYWRYDLEHGVCCARLLRELNGAEESSSAEAV